MSDMNLEDKQENWRAQLRGMNERFASRLDETVFEGVREERIYHGLRINTSTVLHQVYTDVCFCGEAKEYYVLEKGVKIHRYSLQSKHLLPAHELNPALTFSRMMWCEKPKLLVCHEPTAEQIWILTAGLNCLQIVKNEFVTRAVYYDTIANDIIPVDQHNSLKYSLNDLRDDLEATKTLTYVDPESGPSWQLSYTAMITRTSTRLPQLVGSYTTTLYILPLERVISDDDDNDDEEEEKKGTDGPVVYTKRLHNATEVPITALYFNEPSGWIVGGDQQGAVFAWTTNLECVMSHPRAHASPVNGFLDHPSVCGFLSHSYSKDVGSRLQVWSCNFRDRTECYDELGENLGLSVVELAASVVILTPIKLYFFNMRQSYYLFAPLTSQARTLFSMRNPMYQSKVVASSEDNSVRLFSAHGKQLNVQILPSDGAYVVSAVYGGNKNELYTIMMKSGEILVSDLGSSPARFKHVIINDGPSITCIAVYEYYDEIRLKKPAVYFLNNVRMIAGTVEGKLLIINVDTGVQEAAIKAHIGAVKELKAFVTSQRVISLGVDKNVKVWRMFADLNEPLVVYYSLHFTISMAYVSSMGMILCMVSSSEYSKAHTLLMEDMRTRKRLDHPSSKDHEAFITDMIASETLRICATSSMDKTIRIWDHENSLLKILDINFYVKVITFSSIVGDIVFSAGRHLYRIPCENYLTSKYRAKIAIEGLAKEEDVDPTAEDLEYRVYDEEVNRDLMLRPVVSIELAALDLLNLDKPKPHVLIKKQICALYEFRDEDVRKMKESLITSTSTIAHRGLMVTEDWDKYVSDLLKQMTRPAPPVPEYEFKKFTDEQKEKKRVYNEPGVFHMLYGYGIDETEAPEDLENIISSSRLPLNGFLPNSVLYKEKEKKVVEVVVEKEPSVKREPVRYTYPREFYPEESDEDDDERRVSLRLSDLMGGNAAEGEEEDDEEAD